MPVVTQELVEQLNKAMPHYVQALMACVEQKAELITNLETFQGHSANYFALCIAYALQLGIKVILVPENDITAGVKSIIYGEIIIKESSDGGDNKELH